MRAAGRVRLQGCQSGAMPLHTATAPAPRGGAADTSGCRSRAHQVAPGAAAAAAATHKETLPRTHSAMMVAGLRWAEM